MKSDVKKNLWEIAKYLLTLGISALVKWVRRKRAEKNKLSDSYTLGQVDYAKRLQRQLNRSSELGKRYTDTVSDVEL